MDRNLEFAIRLRRRLGLGERSIRRAIMEAFGLDCPERTIRGWINGQHIHAGNCVGFRECPELAYIAASILGDGTRAFRSYRGHTYYIVNFRGNRQRLR